MTLRTILACTALVAATGSAQQATPSPPAEQPPEHRADPPFVGSLDDRGLATLGRAGFSMEHDRDPRASLAQARRLAATLAGIGAERPGTVDAYVVAAALDTDPVFAREAREAGRVLAARYGAQGRTAVLAGPDGRGGVPLPMGSPDALGAVLAQVAERMGPEDVLVLYTTSHGARWGVVYDDGDTGFGAIGPARLRAMLDGLGIRRRLVMVSACFSGVFVPALKSPTTAIVTAASDDRTSFGCQADNDWTFFGDALVNHALRKPQPLSAAAAEAQATIAGWEKEGGIKPSRPQVSIGDRVDWLAALEAHLAPVGEPVGRPATGALGKAAAAHH